MYVLKFTYRKILMPLAKRLLFIHPDIISYSATVVAAGTMLCYLFADRNPSLLIWSIVLTLLRMTMNTIDGVIAIERGNLRLKGEIVNALPDRYSDIFILVGIALSPLCRPVWGMIGIASMFLVSYTGMLGKAIGVEWQHQGPLGKVERLSLLMLVSFLQYLNFIGRIPALSVPGYPITYMEAGMMLFPVLGQITVFNRLREQLRQVKILEWKKYNPHEKKILVAYDSYSGNTEKAAQAIADCLDADIQKIDALQDVGGYDLVILGSPNCRKVPSQRMMDFLGAHPAIRNYSVFITSGLPLWRLYSTPKCIHYFEKAIGTKPISTINIKGYHQKYKTYAHHPNAQDLEDARLFGIDAVRKITHAN
jgi:phosphatidylglycerophosphate synthase/flavodoxin